MVLRFNGFEVDELAEVLARFWTALTRGPVRRTRSGREANTDGDEGLTSNKRPLIKSARKKPRLLNQTERSVWVNHYEYQIQRTPRKREWRWVGLIMHAEFAR